MAEQDLEQMVAEMEEEEQNKIAAILQQIENGELEQAESEDDNEEQELTEEEQLVLEAEEQIGEHLPVETVRHFKKGTGVTVLLEESAWGSSRNTLETVEEETGFRWTSFGTEENDDEQEQFKINFRPSRDDEDDD